MESCTPMGLPTAITGLPVMLLELELPRAATRKWSAVPAGIMECLTVITQYPLMESASLMVAWAEALSQKVTLMLSASSTAL